MAVIDELAVLLTAQTTKFTQGMVQASASLTNFATTALGLRSISFGFQDIERSISQLADLTRTAQRLGETVQGIQQLEFLSRTTGTDFEQFSGILGKLEIHLGEAAAGSLEAEGKLRRLGLTSKQLQFETPTNQLKLLADAFQRLPSRAQQAFEAQQLFGRGAIDVLRQLDKGSEGLQRFFDQADQVGLVSAQDAQKVQDLSNSIGHLSFSFDAAARSMTAEFQPALAKVVELLGKGLAAAKLLSGFLREQLSLTTGGVFTPSTTFAEDAVAKNDEVFAAFLKNIQKLGADLGPTQKRIDDLIDNITKIGRANKQLAAGEEADKLRAKSQSIADSYVKIANEIKAAQGPLDELLKKEAEAVDQFNALADEQTRIIGAEPRSALAKRQVEIDVEQTTLRNTIAALDQQIAAEQERLKKLGASAKSPAEELKKFEQQVTAVEKAFQRGAKHTEEFRSPIEKLKEGIAELKEEFNLGAISAETLSQGIEHITQEFLKSRQSIGAAVAGTSGGFSAIAQALNQGNAFSVTSGIAARIISEKRLNDAVAEGRRLLNGSAQAAAKIANEFNRAADAARRLKDNSQFLQRVPTREEINGILPLEAPPVIRQSLQQVPQRPFAPLEAPAPAGLQQRVPTREEMNGQPLLEQLREHTKLIKEAVQELKAVNNRDRQRVIERPKTKELSTIP